MNSKKEAVKQMAQIISMTTVMKKGYTLDTEEGINAGI